MHRSARWIWVPFTGLGLLVTTTGVKCDSEARASFRQAAVRPVGEGVKDIINGLLDGAIAAIEQAGDGPEESSQ